MIEECVKMAENKGTKKVDFKIRCQTTWRDIVMYRWLYFLLIPGILFFVIFKYVPMGGLRIAFMDYNQYNPAKSTWVGFDQFDFPMGCCLYGGFSP